MKPQDSRKVKKAMKSQGWVFLRDVKGSHEIWGVKDGSVRHSVPFRHSEISPGVLNQLSAKGLEWPKEWR